MRPLAILGGTFDPIHIAHLAVAWEAAELLDADVRLMPAAVPPHRPPPIADATTRVAIFAALRGQDRLGLDTRELARGGPSYTIDTLAELRAEEGDRPIVLLMGADAFAGLTGWHRWHALRGRAHRRAFAPGCRARMAGGAGQQVVARQVADPRQLCGQPAGKIVELDVTPLDISATRIRDLLAAGRDPRYLLPEALFDDPALLAPYASMISRRAAVTVTVRIVARADHDAWLSFVTATTPSTDAKARPRWPAEITRMTWSRFFDAYEPVHALVAEADGELLGPGALPVPPQHDPDRAKLLLAGPVHACTPRGARSRSRTDRSGVRARPERPVARGCTGRRTRAISRRCSSTTE